MTALAFLFGLPTGASEPILNCFYGKRTSEEGVELECYTDLQELLEKAEHYSSNPDQASAIAARGRQAVLERHTIAGRVAEMLQAIRS